MANEAYRGRGARWELKKSKAGNEYLEIWFRLLDHTGDEVRWAGSFTEDAYRYTLEAMRICGWDGVNLADLDGVLANEVDLVLEEHEYKGRVSQQVKYINEPGKAQSIGQLSDTERLSFAKKMAGKVAQWNAQKGTKPPAQSARKPTSTPPVDRDEPPPRTDDDMPF